MPIALAALALVAGSWAEATAPFAVTATTPDTIRVTGTIRDSDDRRFAAALTPATRRIVVNSAGGQVSTALAIAAAIEARGIAVVVDGFCVSSCANYLFAAGATRVLRPGALLLWHGAPDPASRPAMLAQLTALLEGEGLPPPEIAATRTRENARLDGWIAAQDALYRRRGLDTAVLYRLNGPLAVGKRTLYVDPAASDPTEFARLSPEALRCAGFAVRVEGKTDPAIRDLAGIRVVALPALERALCGVMPSEG